jgi:hypothetical protein
MIRNVLDDEHRIPFFVRYMTVLHADISMHHKHPQIVHADKAYIALSVAAINICWCLHFPRWEPPVTAHVVVQLN